MTEPEVLALVAAIAKVNGHPDPDGYAASVAEQIKAKAEEDAKVKKKKGGE